MKLAVVVVVIAGALVLGAFLVLQDGAPAPDETEGRDGVEAPPLTPEERAWSVVMGNMGSIDEEVRAGTLEIIFPLDDDRVDRLVRRSLESDESAMVRIRAAGLLALEGGEDRVAFVRAIAKEEDDYDAFIEASRAYGRMGTPACVDELIKILIVEGDIDSDEDSQSVAAHWLARVGDRRAVPALRGQLEADDELVRYAAAAALFLMGETDVMPTLAEGLEDDAESVVPLLAAPGNDAAVPVLAAVIADEADEHFDEDRGAAAIALARIGTDAARAALVTAWEALRAPPEGAEPGALALLKGHVASALALAGDDRALPAVVEAAKGPGDVLARRALEAIARLGRGLSKEELAATLEDPGERPTFERIFARAWAARAILEMSR